MITFEKFDISQYSHCAIVTDGKLQRLYGIFGDNVFVLPTGEKSKNFHCVKQLCSWFLQRKIAKQDLVVAIGGGSVGDATGFAASVYKRGVRLLHVPTTLLAQIDSSIGGKTALNLDGVKNAIGTIYPADTLIDVRFLETLPTSQRKNGLGELLKYRMLSSEIDAVYAKGDLVETIRACAMYKQSVCERDLWDKGERRLLNFGHTVGHALELTARLPHGQAVANGIYYEIAIANALGLCTDTYAEYWQSQAKGICKILPLSDDVLQLVLQDKKNIREEIGFVLPTDSGFVQKYLQPAQVEQILTK